MRALLRPSNTFHECKRLREARAITIKFEHKVVNKALREASLVEQEVKSADGIQLKSCVLGSLLVPHLVCRQEVKERRVSTLEVEEAVEIPRLCLVSSITKCFFKGAQHSLQAGLCRRLELCS